MGTNSIGTNLYQENWGKNKLTPGKSPTISSQERLQTKDLLVQAEDAPEALAEFAGSHPRGTTTKIKEEEKRNARLSAESSNFSSMWGRSEFRKHTSFSHFTESESLPNAA